MICNRLSKICQYPINCNRRQECLSPQQEKKMDYRTEEFEGGLGRTRHGSPIFYALLKEMAETHDKKSHDYASDGDPFANYKFAGMLSKVFTNPDDAGFLGRIGEKIFRLANLENPSQTGESKIPLNESIEDTEKDIPTIVTLWIAMRRLRRSQVTKDTYKQQIKESTAKYEQVEKVLTKNKEIVTKEEMQKMIQELNVEEFNDLWAVVMTECDNRRKGSR